MSNNKIKILATLSFVSCVFAIIAFAPNYSVNADSDEFVKEIANYKTWSKVNKEPIKVDNSTVKLDGGFVIDGLSGGG